MLARRFRVKETIPWFDGARLDDIVDYLTYVFAPIVLLWTTDRLPDGAARLGASPRCRCWRPATSSAGSTRRPSDHFFLGFPSYWNVVAFYVIVLDVGRPASAIALVVFTVLVFVPVRYVYPSRTDAAARRSTLALAARLAGHLRRAARCSTPTRTRVVVALSLAYLVYYVGLSLCLTVRGAGAPAAHARRSRGRLTRSATRSAVSSMPQDSRTKPGRDGVAAPLRPPVDRAVHAAEAGRRGPQPGAATAAGATAASSASSAETTPLGRSICRAASANDGSPGPPRPPDAGDRRASRPAPRRPPPRSPPAGPAAGPGCSSTGGRARPRTGPGCCRCGCASAGAARSRSSSVVLTWPSSRSLCPVSALVSLPTVRSAPSSSGRWPERRRGRVVDGDERAGRVRRPGDGGDVADVEQRVAGRLQEHQPDAVQAAAGGDRLDLRRRHVVDPRRRTAPARRAASSRVV